MATNPSRTTWFRVRNVFVLGFLLQAGIAAAQNLAANAGFETGSTTGWFAFGPPTISASTAQVHSGTYSGLVQNRTSAWNGIAQSFQSVLSPGQTYNVSAWVRLVSGSSQTIQFTVQKVDGAGTAYTPVDSASVSSTAWTQLSGQYTLSVSGALTNLNIYFEVPTSSNASFYVDDLLVESVFTGSSTGQCTVNWTNVFQRIDGFGASSAWRSSWTAGQADMFFSTNSGIGLSLLRTRIAPGATTVESSIMQMAQARGARVWSSPWSPQTSFKSANANGVISVNGGPFVGNAVNYQAYANQLAGYVVNMKNTYGINLYALSVQNEPDTDTTNYESCVWTGQQFHDFIPYLSASLTASNVASTKIMLPESIHWPNTSLHSPTMNDGAVAPLVGIVANHNYDGPNFQTGATSAPVGLSNYGKALWETEASTGDAFDGGISNGVYWAGRIHQFMTGAQANAWHFWWLVPLNADNQGLTDQSMNPTKRMYALGNFSRFVRPNYYRIGVVSNTGMLQISAYKDPTNGAVAIVVINPGSSNITQTFNLSGFSVTNLTPWITSATQSLASQAPLSVSGPSFTNIIPPLSIVTFVGQTLNNNLAPTNMTLSNSTLGENQPSNTTVGALTTTNPNTGDSFAYALASGTGSTDNGSFTMSGSNLVTATTFNYEAQNSFSIRVRSTDQGGLSVEKVFTITVTNVNEAPTDIALSSSSVGENQSSGTTVGALSTTDPDVGNTSNYALVAGTGSTDNSSFSISGSNLSTVATFNYEMQSSCSIRVRSTDQGGLSVEKVFTIDVANVNEAPSLAAVPDAAVGVGVNLSITNIATDPDVPVQTLTFALLNGPANTAVNASNGVFTWRPLVSQQNQVFPVVVRVYDNGSPSLSATNTFTLTVNPLAPSTLNLISVAGTQVSLGVNGAVGPDYTLWSATNLTDWQTLATSTPVSLPFTLSVTNTEPQRFYRLQLGP